ncbi:MAG: cyclic nucleotide-binding domain-containing protein [Acidobacteriota bacterium]|nr:MAG: cyclic nucleotide-binding domain-containing protein [Acidobacteriota bacterium]
MSEDFTVTLANNKIFNALSEGELAALSSIATPVHFKRGESIFQESEVGDSFYQVVEGKVSITKRDSTGVEREVASLGGNEILGEMALLSEAPRSASAKCVEDTQLLRILKTDFDDLLEAGNVHAHRVVRHMAKVLCGRVCEMNDALSTLLQREAARSTPELAALRERLMKEWSF